MNKKRIFTAVLGFLCFLLAGIAGLEGKAKAAGIVKGIPEENAGLWQYVGKSLPTNAGTIWIQGNSYQKPSKWSQGVIDTSSEERRLSSIAVREDEFLKDARICILYLPTCPYTHSYLPQYQRIAGDAKAKVMLVDVYQYRTASLLPFYDSLNQGCVSPTVLYVRKDGTLGGRTGLHSTKEFAEILKECGYTPAEESLPDTGYTSKQQYKDEVLRETNRRRIENGRLPLSVFKAIDEAADIRAKEIVKKPAHERPNGQMYISLMNFSYPNQAGENLCAGPAVGTPEMAVQAWMNSKPHRENLLNPIYTHMGAGYYDNSKGEGYKDHWIQLFSGKCDITSIGLSQNNVRAAKGVPLSDLNLTAVLHCSIHGDSTMPLIDEMTEGYDKDQPGEQLVKVKYGELTANLLVTVGEIQQSELTEDMVRFAKGTMEAPLVYSGHEKEPEVVVSNPTGVYTLLKDYSYSVTYKDNINAGVATVIVKGKGNYKGTVTKHFEIQPKNLSGNAAVEGLSKTYEYTGKAVTPALKVKIGSKVLKLNKDYTVEFNNNIGELKTDAIGRPNNVTGTAEVLVKGIGNYRGTLTKNFGFSLNPVHKHAEILRYALKPNKNYAGSVYEYWKMLKEKMPALNYEMALKSTLKNLDGYKKGDNEDHVTLDDIMNCSLAPDIDRYIQDFYRFYAEAEQNIKADVTVENQTSAIEGKVTMEGLEASLQAGGNQAAYAVLTVKDSRIPLEINEEKYDPYNTVALDIALSMDGNKADLSVPVTISMRIPDGFSTDDEIAVLHYENGAENPPVELLTTVKGDILKFKVKSFSPFAIVKKLEQFDSSEAEAPVINDPESSGVNFGVESNEGPSAPQSVKAVRTKNNQIKVTWKEAKNPEGSSWKIKGYCVKYSKDIDMSQAMNAETQGNQILLTGLEKGTYYITVSTLASAEWTQNASRESRTVMVKLPENSMDMPGEPELPKPDVPGEEKPETGNTEKPERPDEQIPEDTEKPGENKPEEEETTDTELPGSDGEEKPENSQTEGNESEKPDTNQSGENETETSDTDGTVEQFQKQVTIKFKANGGKLSFHNKKVVQGDYLGKLPSAKRKGYTFAGWYTHKTVGRKMTERTRVKGKATLYAHWIKGKIPKAKITGLKAGKRSVTVKFQKQKQTSYQIRYAAKSNMKGAKIINTAQNSKTIKKLKSGKKYYFQVRAFKKDRSGEKIFGKWSQKKVVRTR